MSLTWSNFASGLLLTASTDVSTTVTVQSGQGDRFPSPTGDDYAVLVLEDVYGNREVVHMTSRAGDNLVIDRAKENTTARGFPAGSRVEVRYTAQFFRDFVDGGFY